MNKLTALDLMVISDTLYRTLSIAGFEGTLGGYTKEARENVANKVQTILSNMEVELTVEKTDAQDDL
jgi:hypothetical protein